MIRNIKLYINSINEALELAKLVKKKFESNYFNITDVDYDLVVAIGGDGTFLKMVRDEKFNSDIYYVGVNAGHLGFLQEVKIDDIDNLIKEIQEEKYNVFNTDIQETLIKNIDGDFLLYSLNDIIIRDVMHSKTLKADVYRHDGFLENFSGSAILFLTSLGSSAYNKSVGGCLISPEFSILQFSPVAPNFSCISRLLSNSVLESDKGYFKIVPYNKNINICYDSEEVNINDVDSIITRISDKKIKRLVFSDYSYSKRINEKFLQ